MAGVNYTSSMHVKVSLTMDCEPAHGDVSPYGLSKSSTGPTDYLESERSIKGYVKIAEDYGFTPTLFVHPEVAMNQSDLLLSLEDNGVCLGLHLHPYKLNEDYKHDLGSYAPSEQREILEVATNLWRDALGRDPKYFRGGRYSANDNTIRILRELGFEGGSLSNVGRVLPEYSAVWAGSEPYPHQGHEGFRHLKGDSEFIEVPTLGDASQPIEEVGDADESDGYEWLYIPSKQYKHQTIVENLIARFKREQPEYFVIMTNTHNDMDYSSPDHHATENLILILETIKEYNDINFESKTISAIVNDIRN